MRTLDYNLIKALVVFVEEGSVTRAAERLHLSQPATSAVLQKLRQAMDDPVLVRSGNTMVPTERALEACERARPLEDQVTAVFDAPQIFDPATSTQRFQLAVTDYAMYRIVPEVLGYVAHHAPGMTLDFQSLDRWTSRRDILESLRSGTLEAIVGMTIPVDKDIRTRALVEEPFRVLGQREPGRNRLSLKRFLAVPHLLVSFSGDRHGLVDRALAAIGQQRQVAHTLNNYLEGALILQRTDYYLVAPASVAALLAERFELQSWALPLEMPSLSVSLYWHRTTETSPAQQWLRMVLSGQANV